MATTASEIIDKQIANLEKEIMDNKVEIADLFLSFNKRKSTKNCDLESFISRFDDVDKMFTLIQKHETKQTQLEVLLKSKAEIDKAVVNLL
jgi:hypothetical protein